MNPTSSAIVRFLFLLSFPQGTAASMDEPWSARHRALSGARCAVYADPASVAVNPSGIASLESIAATISYIPGVVGLPELKTHSITCGVPTSFGGIGIGARRFGFDLYRETSLLVGGGVKVDDEMAVGVCSEFRRYEIKGYGAQTIVLLNCGAVKRLHEALAVSGTIHNALNATLGKKRERIPRTISLGVLVTLGSEFLGVCEIEKSTRDPAFLKAAIEFRPLPPVALRAGFSTDPMVWNFGCSVSAGFLSFGYGGTNYGVLGWTHQLDVDFRWQE
ncbi:MAG: hypothetical protein WEB37_05415 [Bacteroidota bacterium]